MATARRESSHNEPLQAPGGEPPMGLSGAPLPAHLRRKLAPRRPAGADPLAREIAHLLRLHPDVDRDYSAVDLQTLGGGTKRHMLALIRERLGIPDVGPEL